MENTFKRLFSLAMAFVMVFCFTISAFAADVDDTPANLHAVSTDVDEIPTETHDFTTAAATTRASLGDQIAFASGTIYNGFGSVVLHLYSGNFWTDLQAQLAHITVDSLVSVTCTTPDGDLISLGSISGNGTRTDAYELFYAPAGDYTFTFISSSTKEFTVAVYAYD